jgi:hypothetical protein
MKQLNFGRNVRLTPKTAYAPKNEQEVLAILEGNRGRRIRCIGRLHSWSRAIESDDVLLDLRHLHSVLPNSDLSQPSVQVGAGCQVKRLLTRLQSERGWTLPSVGFITEQTVAGAISTGTHGSGRNSLSHYVLSVRIARYSPVTGQAVIDEIDAGEELRAARCSLGCLGVIVSVNMQCRPLYAVEELFREYRCLADVIEAEREFPLQQFYLVPWRWTYFAQHRRETELPRSKLASLYHWYRFLVFDVAMHCLILFLVRILRLPSAVRLAFRSIVPATVIRNWHVVAPSNAQLVMEHERFRHVEIELFVQSSKLEDALGLLRTTLEISGGEKATGDRDDGPHVDHVRDPDETGHLRGKYCHHYPICIRKVLPDDTHISMASHAGLGTSKPVTPTSRQVLVDEPWYSITLTNYQTERQREGFNEVSSFLARSMARQFGARLHWGKLFPLALSEAAELYPAFETFRDICSRSDPNRVFCNDWTEELLA